MKIKIIALAAALPVIAVFASACTHRDDAPPVNNDDRGIFQNENEFDQNAIPDNRIEEGGMLDLSNQEITELPDEVLQRTNIIRLDLSGNRLQNLPAEIGRLSNLEELYIEDNMLTGTLPAEIRMMRNLRVLDVSGNQLTGIPAEIGQLENLAALDLSSNNLSTYPNELLNLQNLEILNISNNNFNEESVNIIREALPNTTIVN
jgi:Leucine-rich repeat (LRR) protein